MEEKNIPAAGEEPITPDDPGPDVPSTDPPAQDLTALPPPPMSRPPLAVVLGPGLGSRRSPRHRHPRPVLWRRAS